MHYSQYTVRDLKGPPIVRHRERSSWWLVMLAIMMVVGAIGVLHV